MIDDLCNGQRGGSSSLVGTKNISTVAPSNGGPASSQPVNSRVLGRPRLVTTGLRPCKSEVMRPSFDSAPVSRPARTGRAHGTKSAWTSAVAPDRRICTVPERRIRGSSSGEVRPSVPGQPCASCLDSPRRDAHHAHPRLAPRLPRDSRGTDARGGEPLRLTPRRAIPPRRPARRRGDQHADAPMAHWSRRWARPSSGWRQHRPQRSATRGAPPSELTSGRRLVTQPTWAAQLRPTNNCGGACEGVGAALDGAASSRFMNVSAACR